MKLAEFFEKNKWNVECDVKDDHQFVIVLVTFINERKMEDQVSLIFHLRFCRRKKVLKNFQNVSEIF